ncbi:MAG: N-acetylmuramoyl-L-alanine amidase [Sphingorhabdus sp.]|nr:N-acetylmuramoyl-L-alanine amidase [Sphingorhabdus sp.]
MPFTALIASGIFVASPFAAAPASAGTVDRVSVTENSVTIYFDDTVNKASIFSLSGPNRIAVDILGANTGGASSVGGPVSSVRQGQLNRDTARVVFDLLRPALVTGAQFASDGRSLRLNLQNAGPNEFAGRLPAGRKEIVPPSNFRASPPKKRYEVTAPIGSGLSARGLPKIYGPADKSLPLVVIDAGHGGHDPGAISPHDGTREKVVTLAVARSIRDELVKSGRVRVALTRDNDRFLVLEDRFGVARKLGANLFISIHADAAGSAEANGATVYTLSETASDREAQKLAARENKANIINGVNLGGADNNVSSILIDLTQRETMNVSADFAKLLLREARPNLRLRSDSHKFASFVVLKAPDTPSILFETGYISNATDSAFLASKAGQQKIARSVASAVQVHFARRLASR